MMIPPSRRAEDNSGVGRLLYWSNKYTILWVPLLALCTAFGFGFKTPAQQQFEFANKMRATEAKLDTEIVIRRNVESKINLLLRLECITSKLPDRDMQLIGLNCKQLLSGQ